jgi:hypothetical protein
MSPIASIHSTRFYPLKLPPLPPTLPKCHKLVTMPVGIFQTQTLAVYILKKRKGIVE